LTNEKPRKISASKERRREERRKQRSSGVAGEKIKSVPISDFSKDTPISTMYQVQHQELRQEEGEEVAAEEEKEEDDEDEDEYEYDEDKSHNETYRRADSNDEELEQWSSDDLSD
jgi:hypothetical protein